MSQPAAKRGRTLTNSLFGVLSWISPIVIGFIATPIIVRHLGTRDYGLYTTLLGFVSYSFAFGFSKVLVKFIAELRASNESERLSAVISATIWLSIILCLIVTVGMFVFADPIARDLLLIESDQMETARVGLMLVGGAIVVTIISQLFQNSLQGIHEFRTYLLLTTLNGILLNAGNILLAVLGYSAVLLLVWNLVALTIMLIIFARYALAKIPEFSINPSKAMREMPPVFTYSANIIFYQIFANALYVFERICVVRNFGTEAATYYVIPMTIGIYLHGITASAVQAIFPVFNENLSQPERLIGVYLRSTKLFLAVLIFGASVILANSHLLLSIWVGKEIADKSSDLLIIHTLTFGSIALIMNTWAIAETFRYPSINVGYTLFWGIVSVTLMTLFATKGLEAIAISRLVPVVLTLPMIFVLEHWFLGGVKWKFWASSATRVIVAAALVFFVSIAGAYFLPEGPIRLTLVLTVSGMAFGGALLGLGYLDRNEQNMIWSLLRSKRI